MYICIRFKYIYIYIYIYKCNSEYKNHPETLLQFFPMDEIMITSSLQNNKQKNLKGQV